MPRVKEFAVVTPANNEWLADAAENADKVRRINRAYLDEAQRGPRGGLYLPFGDIREDVSTEAFDAWDRNLTWFRARRMGRYVRPHRPLQDATAPVR